LLGKEKQTETVEESAGRKDPAEFLSGVDNLDLLVFSPAVAQNRWLRKTAGWGKNQRVKNQRIFRLKKTNRSQKNKGTVSFATVPTFFLHLMSTKSMEQLRFAKLFQKICGRGSVAKGKKTAPNHKILAPSEILISCLSPSLIP